MPFSFLFFLSLYCNFQLEGISSDVSSLMIRGWGGHWVNSLVTWSVTWTGYKYSHTCTTRHRVRPASKVRYACGKLKSCERKGRGHCLVRCMLLPIVRYRSRSSSDRGSLLFYLRFGRFSPLSQLLLSCSSKMDHRILSVFFLFGTNV